MLNSLQLINFRCFKESTFQFSDGLNLITGKNGSGKSSFLESLYLAGRGKSFRDNSHKVLINQSADLSYLHLLIDHKKLSAEISSKNLIYKYQYKPVNKRSELLDILPLQILTPSSHQIVESGPSQRRKFLDWGLFHVEQSYRDLYARFSRTLKQRNELLKSKNNEVTNWNDQFVHVSQLIDDFRRNYFSEVSKIFSEIQSELKKDYELSFDYFPGWNSAILSEELESQLTKELKYGWTTIGPHKADIKFLVDGSPQNTLSRGQQKLFIFILQLSQCVHFMKTDNVTKPVFLIDDLSSELDHYNQQLICDLLHSFKLQSFITNIETQHLNQFCQNVFHVEH